MSITAGKRRHVNICASALTLCLPPHVPLPHSEQRREIQEEGILLSLVWIKLEQDLHTPFSCLIFTNSGKQLILKLIHFSTTSRGKSSQITSVKLLWCALYSSCFNVKKTSNIQVQGGEEEKKFVTLCDKSQAENGRDHPELQGDLGFSRYKDTGTFRR